MKQKTIQTWWNFYDRFFYFHFPKCILSVIYNFHGASCSQSIKLQLFFYEYCDLSSVLVLITTNSSGSYYCPGPDLPIVPGVHLVTSFRYLEVTKTKTSDNNHGKSCHCKQQNSLEVWIKSGKEFKSKCCTDPLGKIQQSFWRQNVLTVVF